MPLPLLRCCRIVVTSAEQAALVRRILCVPVRSLALESQGHDMMRLPVTASAAREVDVVGVFRYRNAYPTAIKLISSGAVNCQPLITHRFSLAEEFSPDTIKEGFKVSAGGGNAIKVMFDLVPDASSTGTGA